MFVLFQELILTNRKRCVRRPMGDTREGVAAGQGVVAGLPGDVGLPPNRPELGPEGICRGRMFYRYQRLIGQGLCTFYPRILLATIQTLRSPVSVLQQGYPYEIRTTLFIDYIITSMRGGVIDDRLPVHFKK